MDDNKNKKLPEKARPFLQIGITALIELFTEAVCTSVMSHVDGGKFAKFGARIGAGLVGLKVGSDVSDYVCDGLEALMSSVDGHKEAIEEAKEGT